MKAEKDYNSRTYKEWNGFVNFTLFLILASLYIGILTMFDIDGYINLAGVVIVVIALVVLFYYTFKMESKFTIRQHLKYDFAQIKYNTRDVSIIVWVYIGVLIAFLLYALAIVPFNDSFETNSITFPFVFLSSYGLIAIVMITVILYWRAEPIPVKEPQYNLFLDEARKIVSEDQNRESIIAEMIKDLEPYSKFQYDEKGLLII